VASTLSWTLMNFIDAAILFRVSSAAMSASFSASVTWFAMLSLFWGVCSYASTFVSQYHGDDQPEKIGPVVWQGVWLAALFTPFALAAIPVAPHLFSMHKPELGELETRFFQILCWGAPGMLCAQSLEAFFSGRGRTLVVMGVDAAAVLVNLALACVWVLGWGGGPSWGIDGAAWATVAAQYCRAAFFASLALRPVNRARYNTWACRVEPRLIGRMIKFGGPSGVQMLLDIGGFTAFILMVGKLGMVETEATSMTFRISQLAFMPVWGFGLATVVLVGQRLGECRPDLAERAARTALVVTVGYMGLISLLFVLTPGVFLQSFVTHGQLLAAGAATTTDTLATQEAIRELAVDLLRFVAAYNLFDAVVIVFVSVLRGAGDTRFIMIVSMIMATTLAAATWLSVDVLRFDVYGCWAIITGWIWVMGVVYIARFLQGKWRSMRVIDQQHHFPASDERGEESAAMPALLGAE
jgi:MATE family multidrug resistance protein